MKIAFIHLNLSTESGDPRMFYTLARNVKDLGHDVVIYTAAFDPTAFPELHEGMDIRVVPAAENISAMPASGILKKIAERRRSERANIAAADAIGAQLDKDFDALVFQNDPSYRLGVMYKNVNPAAKRIWVMNNAPFYHSKKSNPIVNVLSWAAGQMAKVRLKKFVSGIDVVVVHDNERGDMIRPFGIPVVTLRIPVDFDVFNFPVKPRTVEKKAVLLGVGTLSPARRFEDTISAVAYLRSEGYDARATFICKDFWNEAAYRETLLALTKKSNVENAITFMFSGASEEEFHQIERASDIFVFASTINIWNMSSFEGMAAGLPLVVSDATSLPEVLTDGVTALFFHAGDPYDLASKVKQLIDDPARYQAIAAAGQSFVKENLSWTSYAKEFVSHLS